jgi:hypothetical protein
MTDDDLRAAIQRIDDRLSAEKAEATVIHRTLADHEHAEISQIIDILEGPEIAQLGGPPIRNDGLVDKVNTITEKVAGIEEKLGNGGIKVKLPGPAWVAIVVAIIAGLAQVIAALAN